MNVLVLFPLFDENIHRKKDPWQIPLHLFRLGHEVKIVAYQKNNSDSITSRVDGIEIVRVKPNLLHLLFYLVKNSRNIDCIISYFGNWITLLSGISFKLTKRKGVFVIKMDTDGSYAIKEKNLFRFFHRYFTHLLFPFFVDLIIVESPEARNRILKRYWWLKNKIIVLPNGVDTDTYEELEKSIKRPKRSTKKKIILFVGDVISRKGVDLLIKAFSQLEKEYPNYIVKIVGDVKVDPTYKKFLDKLIQSERISKKVIFLGRIGEKELVEEFHKAEIFCLPSRSEGFSIVLIEAMYFGKAIVASNVGASQFVLDRGKAGLIFEKDNLNDLIFKLRLVMKSERLRKFLGKKAHERCIKYFNWSRIVGKLDSYIRKIRQSYEVG
jgi:glycosyltransferase involved in cell wall biosynthesis